MQAISGALQCCKDITFNKHFYCKKCTFLTSYCEYLTNDNASLYYIVLRCIFVHMKTEMIPIRVDEDLKKRLKALADKDNRTLSDYIRLQLEKLIPKK